MDFLLSGPSLVHLVFSVLRETRGLSGLDFVVEEFLQRAFLRLDSVDHFVVFLHQFPLLFLSLNLRIVGLVELKQNPIVWVIHRVELGPGLIVNALQFAEHPVVLGLHLALLLEVPQVEFGDDAHLVVFRLVLRFLSFDVQNPLPEFGVFLFD